MQFQNGEYKQRINGVEHWIIIEGTENHTTPLVLTMEVLKEMYIHLNGHLGLYYLCIEPLFIKSNVVVEEVEKQIH